MVFARSGGQKRLFLDLALPRRPPGASFRGCLGTRRSQKKGLKNQPKFASYTKVELEAAQVRHREDTVGLEDKIKAQDAQILKLREELDVSSEMELTLARLKDQNEKSRQRIEDLHEQLHAAGRETTAVSDGLAEARRDEVQQRVRRRHPELHNALEELLPRELAVLGLELHTERPEHLPEFPALGALAAGSQQRLDRLDHL